MLFRVAGEGVGGRWGVGSEGVGGGSGGGEGVGGGSWGARALAEDPGETRASAEDRGGRGRRIRREGRERWGRIRLLLYFSFSDLVIMYRSD